MNVSIGSIHALVVHQMFFGKSGSESEIGANRERIVGDFYIIAGKIRQQQSQSQ